MAFPGEGIEAGGGPPPEVSDHELLYPIGRGSYGDVWLARNVLGAYRAVKIVYRKTFANDRPFEREFKGIQKYEPISRSHPSQVNILHIGRTPECFYYVMELADDARQTKPELDCGASSGRAEGEVAGAMAVAHPGSPAGPGMDPAPRVASPGGYVPRTLKSEKQQRGRLPFPECLEIALALTTALAHLHKHGLVHRDIKPSNVVFVQGVPKLADIGLVTDADQTVSFVGTEGFIPPEGPGAPPADIYSLGKVLYELSTGKDRQDYPEPPTRLGEFEDREQLLELRQVIDKACARDPKQRYQTAEAMQADLLLLKTGKSVRRTHQLEQRLRLMTRVGVAVIAVMLLGVVPYFLAIREARLARRQAAKSRQIARVLENMFSGIQPLVAKGRDTALLLELLDQTSGELATNLHGQPDVEADLRMILATSYQQVGQAAKALAMAHEALSLREGRFGVRHRGVADAWSLIGVLRFDQSDYAAAEEAARKALQIRRSLLGPTHTNIAISLNNAGLAVFHQGRFDEAEEFHREALALRIKALGQHHLEVAKSLNNLAMVHIMKGNLPAAEADYRQALGIFEACLPDDHPYIATVVNNIANLQHRKGNLLEADRLHSRALDIRKRYHGASNPTVAGSLTQLARVRAARNDVAGAEQMFRESLSMEENLSLGDHMLVADSLAGLAGVLLRKGEFGEAETRLCEALRIRKKIFGPDSSDAADVLNAQGVLAALRDDVPSAQKIFAEALDMTRRSVGHDHQDLLSSLWLLAWVMRLQGEASAAEPLQNEIGKLMTKYGQYALSALTTVMFELADALRFQSRFAEAESILQEAHRFVHASATSSLPLQRDLVEQMARLYDSWQMTNPGAYQAAKALEWKENLAAHGDALTRYRSN